MHPGNIFAAKRSPKKPFYYAVDYAICGSLSESNQILIAQMISSLLKKDFYSLAQLFIFANWVSEDTKTEELENIGFQTIPSSCNFVLFEVSEKLSFDANYVFDFLCSRGLILRQMHEYNLPNFLRLTIGNDEANMSFKQCRHLNTNPTNITEKEAKAMVRTPTSVALVSGISLH